MAGAIGLSAVLGSSARGWRLFPCRPRDKTPLVREWQHVATTTPEQIRAWYAEYPGCNWGVACGAESGVWVLDVDGPNGEASLKALVERHGSLPAGLTVRTGKGLHLYFAWPAIVELRNSASKIGDGLDVRGEGGYVLAPGSVHPSGAIYAVAKDGPVPAAPEWLVEMAMSPAPLSAITSEDGGADAIAEGKRNAALSSLAGTMRNRGMSAAAIEAALLAENASRCRPPLPEGEVRAIAQSVSRYDPQPRLTAPAPRRADLLTLADVQPREVDWLWEPYLPAGMLAMLSGDPGAGKTYLALAIAAALTTGHVPHSGETCEPTDVLYMSVENDPACVVRPRFDALGGNPARLTLLRGTTGGADSNAQPGAVWLTDISSLRDALDRTHARLMIVDPIQSYLGAEVDAHRSNETRPVLDGLARLAEDYRCCVLLLRHLSKARGGRAIHAGLGSIDLTGAVRTEMLAGCAPDDPQQRAMVQVKSNVGTYGPALGYVIDAQGQFCWTGESALTQADILAPETAERDSAVQEAAEWLREYLSGGTRTAKEVEQAARTKGISWAAVRRAKQAAGVQSRKANFGKGWIWAIEDAQDAEDAQDSQVQELSTFAKNEHLPLKGEL